MKIPFQLKIGATLAASAVMAGTTDRPASAGGRWHRWYRLWGGPVCERRLDSSQMVNMGLLQVRGFSPVSHAVLQATAGFADLGRRGLRRRNPLAEPARPTIGVRRSPRGIWLEPPPEVPRRPGSNTEKLGWPGCLMHVPAHTVCLADGPATPRPRSAGGPANLVCDGIGRHVYQTRPHRDVIPAGLLTLGDDGGAAVVPGVTTP